MRTKIIYVGRNWFRSYKQFKDKSSMSINFYSYIRINFISFHILMPCSYTHLP